MHRNKGRWATAVAIAMASFGLAVPASAAPLPDITVNASADAYVSEAAPTVAEGANTPTESQNCRVNDDTGTRQICYVTFNVTGLGAGDSVTGAQVLLNVKGNSTAGKTLLMSDAPAGFTESSVTWNTRPTLGSQLASVTTLAFNTDASFNVGAGAVPANGTYTFAVWAAPGTMNIGTNFYTKENLSGQPFPRLKLQVDHQSPPVANSVTADDATPDTGQAVTFTVSASDPDNDIVNYRWDFGDGSAQVTDPSTTQIHTFTTAGSYTVAVSPVDSGGREGLGFTGVTVTDPPPPFKTIYGANVDTSSGETLTAALARQDSEYAPKSLRLFFGGLPSSACTTNFNDIQMRARSSIVSFKADPVTLSSGSLDASINAWLDCAPTDKTTYVTYYHEPEDNFTTTQAKSDYRAAGAHFAALVHAHANAANLKTTEIFMDWTWNTASGRTYTDWYWGSGSVDVFGGDMYIFGDRDTNPANDQTIAQHVVLQDWVSTAVSLGKPIIIPEIGFNVIPGSARQVALLDDLSTWAPANHVLVVDYFDANGSWDTRLTATASWTKYHDIVAA